MLPHDGDGADKQLPTSMEFFVDRVHRLRLLYRRDANAGLSVYYYPARSGLFTYKRMWRLEARGQTRPSAGWRSVQQFASGAC